VYCVKSSVPSGDVWAKAWLRAKGVNKRLARNTNSEGRNFWIDIFNFQFRP
jgi:hypothetical protein